MKFSLFVSVLALLCECGYGKDYILLCDIRNEVFVNGVLSLILIAYLEKWKSNILFRTKIAITIGIFLPCKRVCGRQRYVNKSIYSTGICKN